MQIMLLDDHGKRPSPLSQQELEGLPNRDELIFLYCKAAQFGLDENTLWFVIHFTDKPAPEQMDLSAALNEAILYLPSDPLTNEERAILSKGEELSRISTFATRAKIRMSQRVFTTFKFQLEQTQSADEIYRMARELATQLGRPSPNRDRCADMVQQMETARLAALSGLNAVPPAFCTVPIQID